ncbi:MAG: UTP--glucose-1-phosphate uridylyltransferase [Helicobacteraceae bacterium]|jgi:UDPglucose--hexose-1-phosphate uridylyltransferase|nr:UTP--glucose-1-phosphate uridylyltransferase [Helicobacteraceae bacterium]
MSEIRYDRLHDTHVIIAPERLHRPDCNFAEPEKKVVDEQCPFYEGHESMTPPEIFAIRKPSSFKNEAGWQTRVVPNLYKAVQIEAPLQHHYGLFEHLEGFGAHEVIIDTPEHHTSMTQWSEENVIHWLKTLRARVADLRGDHRIAYISLFKNEGTEAGSTQQHSHTQLIGLPIIPKVEREAYQRSYNHYKHHANAILETVLAHEEEDGQRIVAKQGDFTAFCPYASAYPFEVIISSTKALGQVDTLSDESIESLAPLLLITLKKLKKQLGCFDFNLSVSTPPLQEGTVEHGLLACVDEAFRFEIRIMPRIYKHGGFEQTTGVIINPVTPELAAALLREHDYV